MSHFDKMKAIDFNAEYFITQCDISCSARCHTLPRSHAEPGILLQRFFKGPGVV